MAARRIGVQVDADVAVLLNTLHQFGNAGFRVHARRLRQHGRRHKVVREKLAYAVAQFIADRSPCGRHIEVADVVRHETCTRAEDGQVGAALFHEAQLVLLYGLAQLVIADLQVADLGHHRWILDAGDLLVAPGFQSLGRCGVVTVAVNDDGFLKAHFLKS
ncbi:hypothetical protein D9M73_91870 [compost metagenome]